MGNASSSIGCLVITPNTFLPHASLFPLKQVSIYVLYIHTYMHPESLVCSISRDLTALHCPDGVHVWQAVKQQDYPNKYIPLSLCLSSGLRTGNWPQILLGNCEPMYFCITRGRCHVDKGSYKGRGETIKMQMFYLLVHCSCWLSPGQHHQTHSADTPGQSKVKDKVCIFDIPAVYHLLYYSS